MNTRWLLLPLSLALAVACAPAAEEGGNPNTERKGGAGGSRSGGAGGSSSGSTGGSVGSTGGSVGSTGGSTGNGGSSAGGSVGSGGSGAGGRAGSGGSGSDAAPQGEGGTPPGGMGPAGVLDNYVITVPCPAGATGGSCNVATNIRAFDKPLKFGGDPATTYKVTIKMCGLFETRGYTGCSAMPQPRHCVGGTPGTGGFMPTYPTLGLKVAEPAATHWLNGMYQADTIVRIEYTTTIDIKGGSALNFISDGGSNGGIYTQRMKPNFMPCPEVPGVMQPYAGQFMHFKVMSVTPPM